MALVIGTDVTTGKTPDGKDLAYIPYFLWPNRSESQITVWVNNDILFPYEKDVVIPVGAFRKLPRCEATPRRLGDCFRKIAPPRTDSLP